MRDVAFAVSTKALQQLLLSHFFVVPREMDEISQLR
jgi:hypothetical protein